MTIYLWSALSNGQAINFDPAKDQLAFDGNVKYWGDLKDWDIATPNGGIYFTDMSGKKVTFAGLDLNKLSPTNVTFPSGGHFYAGDLSASTVGDDLANVINGSAQGDAIWGFGGNDTINAGAGDDAIWANNGGNDVIDGGDGFDWYNANRGATAGISANLTTGKIYAHGDGSVDTVRNIEAVRGTLHDDFLIGDAAINRFRPLTGNDYVDGRDGSDWVDYQQLSYQATQALDVDLSKGVAINDGYGTTDILVNIENVRGTQLSDRIVGSTASNYLEGKDGDDTISGLDGDDQLDGGLGNDILNGGNGLDWVRFNSATGAVTVNLALTASQNTGGSGIETLSGVENASGSGFNDILTGSALANTLDGGAGNDRLTGGDGSDTLIGGSGNDTLAGGNGNDLLDGGAGADLADYASATAGVTVSLAVATAQNTIGAGIDTLVLMDYLRGSAYADKLTGNAYINAIDGRSGNDLLVGGGGRDTLTGGLGADIFRLTALTDSRVGSAYSDLIKDFSSAQGDRIDVAALDANTSAAGNQAFSFIGTAAFSAAGQLRFDSAKQIVSGDINGDHVADFEVALSGVTTLTAADFVL